MAVTAPNAFAGNDTAFGQMKNQEVVEVATIVTATDTEAIVRDYFSDIPVMIQIARCESTFRHTLADGSVLRGKVDQRDTGVMQINSYYHGHTAAQLGLNLEDMYDNLAYARLLYEKQGTQPWSASASCWNRDLASR